VVEYIPNEHEALSLNPDTSIAPQKKEKKKSSFACATDQSVMKKPAAIFHSGTPVSLSLPKSHAVYSTQVPPKHGSCPLFYLEG
jgi:hypothetical protein